MLCCKTKAHSKNRENQENKNKCSFFHKISKKQDASTYPSTHLVFLSNSSLMSSSRCWRFCRHCTCCCPRRWCYCCGNCRCRRHCHSNNCRRSRCCCRRLR